MSKSSHNLDTPFWKFSLALYRRAGVATECLGLQERYGVDVNLLLYCVYMGASEGIVITDDDLADAASTVQSWHADYVRALRHIRQEMKSLSGVKTNPFCAEIEKLRMKIKTAELDAEQIEQVMLWRWGQSRLSAFSHIKKQEAVIANLKTFLASYGAKGAQADPVVTTPRMLAAVSAK